jgi:protein SCO1/2
MTRATYVVLIAAAALLAALASVLVFNRQGLQDTVVSTVEIGGPFRLAAAKGGVVDTKDLLGSPYGIFFGYTHCPEVCPTTMFEMSKALTTLGEEAKDFRLFFITVDPERDTAEMLKDYLSNFNPRMEALVPTPTELPVVTKEFRAIYNKVPSSDGSYTMDHTATVFLMGRDGKLFGTIRYGEKPDDRVAKLRRLLAAGN